MSAFDNSQTALPHSDVDLLTGDTSRSAPVSSLSEMTTLALEFATLTNLTGDGRYEAAARGVYDALPHGILPQYWWVLVPRLSHSLAHSLTRSLTHSLAHSLTRSLSLRALPVRQEPPHGRDAGRRLPDAGRAGRLVLRVPAQVLDHDRQKGRRNEATIQTCGT